MTLFSMRVAGAIGAAVCKPLQFAIFGLGHRPSLRKNARPLIEPGRTMLEINPQIQTLKDIEARTDVLRGYL